MNCFNGSFVRLPIGANSSQIVRPVQHHQISIRKIQSYHINMKMSEPNGYMYWWPMSGWSQFCFRKKVAYAQFREFQKTQPNRSFKLISHKVAVWSSLYSGHIVLWPDHTVLEHSDSSKVL